MENCIGRLTYHTPHGKRSVRCTLAFARDYISRTEGSGVWEDMFNRIYL